MAAPTDEAAIKAAVLQREKAAIEVFKTHDKKAYAELCLPGFYGITSSGSVNTLADEMQELDDYTLGNYTMDDVVVTLVAPEVALIRCHIRANFSFKGKALPVQSMVASAVWVKKDGVWKEATYQEVVGRDLK